MSRAGETTRGKPHAARSGSAAHRVGTDATPTSASPNTGAQALTVRVVPVPKPRMTRSDRWKQRPSVLKYRAFCDELRLKTRGLKLEHTLRLHFILPMPRSWSKRKRAQHLGRPHQQTPDLDNLIKAFADALYEDDKAIHTVFARKTWGEEGSITISNLEDGQ